MKPSDIKKINTVNKLFLELIKMFKGTTYKKILLKTIPLRNTRSCNSKNRRCYTYTYLNI